jgi:arginyl-tRNA--protein-N-Asp/Glu arginylyltransferase
MEAAPPRSRAGNAVTSQPRDAPQFYLTAPAACPYLPGRQERKVFTHLVGRRALELNDLLTQGGFRRSQTIAYRPACEQCRACVSTRIVVDDFRPGRTFRRIWRDNDDLIGSMGANRPTSEQYSLFRAYLESRHSDGGMVDMTVLDYAMMVEDSHVDTRIVEYRRRGPDSFIRGKGTGPLYAVALTDVLADGLSMVYSYFEPDAPARSLGTFLILDHIARARAMGLPYVYLGYWVEGSAKMAYKARFQPQERLMPGGWQRADAAANASSRRETDGPDLAGHLGAFLPVKDAT